MKVDNLNKDVPSLNSEMLKMEKSNNEFKPHLWLRLADQDYVTTRLLIYYDLERLATYHMQQAVEKYLKSFILKHYKTDNKNTEKPIIKCCKNNNGSEIEFRTHDLDKLLKCCQEKNDFFKDENVGEFIDILKKFDTIRYPNQLVIDNEILQYFDYFARKVRDIINIEIIDLINHLQIGPVINWGYGVTKNEYREIFFYRNKWFEKIDSEKGKPDSDKK
ncbi:MAG: HEPN domain-containing protein [ANME-2 cluster archaeon]|nr:MAG: HEPN domain-containing protein [ANME-2 cluster archaeon]